MTETALTKIQEERSTEVSSVRKKKSAFYPEDQLNQAVLEYWRNRMAFIKQARLDRGEK